MPGPKNNGHNDHPRTLSAQEHLPMRDFAHSLPMALLRAREAMMIRFRSHLRQHGMTEQQWRVLRVLVEIQDIEITQLAERCFILSPSLSRILQNLEGRKLILRKAVQSDQRRAAISITAGGRRLFERAAAGSEERYAEIETAVGAAKIAKLYELLDDVEDALNHKPA